MKSYKNIYGSLLMLVAIVIAGSGCSKFLDRKPLTATLNDLNQGALESQSLGLYNTLRAYAGFSTLPWIDFNSIRDDDAQKGSSLTDGAEINAEFETFQYTKDDWATNTYWNDHYYMINLCNKELHWADSLKVTDDASLRNVGEAHFFRAYSFFELVKAYGEVPLINYYYTSAADGIKAKSTVTDIYAQIDRDLDSASKLLPLNWNVGGTNRYPGRLTSGAANTLWAQTYMFRQQWAKVVTLCNAVINSGQYSLSTNFTDIWKDGLNGAGKNGPESIFEMQSLVGANGTNWNGSQWGTSQNVRQGGADVSWNLGWGWNTPTQNLVSAWDNSDPRKSMTILYSGQFDGGPAQGGYGATLPPYNAASPGSSGSLDQPYWNKKVYSDPAMRQYTGQINGSGGADWINHRILRYADVLLMLAEASNELGDGATAEKYLEMVRARARNGNSSVLPHIAFSNQAQMRQAIKDERRWEFAMEGYRFYDLVRWGDAPTVLAPLGYTPRCQYYPIPQKAIDLSGGVLKQNPLW
ncbi:MAG: RagB/SusD family nutrient uptake outer membrane protein [Bacteroidota bacterium]|nr:RagB/SusD family nutrient uptake outer membrane protein [Bacteroidota bacterium]